MLILCAYGEDVVEAHTGRMGLTDKAAGHH